MRTSTSTNRLATLVASLSLLSMAACGGSTSDLDQGQTQAGPGTGSGNTAGTSSSGGQSSGQGGAVGSTGGAAGKAGPGGASQAGGAAQGGAAQGGAAQGGGQQSGGAQQTGGNVGVGGMVGGCSAGPQPGAACTDEGLSCQYAVECGTGKCTCAMGSWQCELPSCPNPGCSEGAACTLGPLCTVPQGDCTLVCQCDAAGKYACKQECASTCTGVLVCGEACSNPGEVCSCAGPGTEALPCVCQASPAGARWSCGAPTDCLQGGMCSAGSACSTGSGPGGQCGTTCKCTDAGTYDCVSDCPQPMCPQQPQVCGAKCPPVTLDGCKCLDDTGNVTACGCNGSQWQCEAQPGDCFDGAPCTPGSGCGGSLPNGCNQSCSCGPDGVFQCDVTCPQQCPPFSPACGSPCKAIGATCECLAGACTCQGSPATGGVWVCGGTGDCNAGQACTPGSGCATPLPGGCTQGCDCGPDGVYSCSVSCSGSCPAVAPACNSICDTSQVSSTCTCEGNQSCTCGGPFGVPRWVCGTDPSQCAAGLMCVSDCKVETSPGCVMTCTCGSDGVYAGCAEGCTTPGCPDTPLAGQKCDQPGNICNYPGTTCACSNQGIWQCF